MKALQIKEIGTTPTLVETARPRPGPGQIGVRIAACALNFADLLMVDGRYQEQPDLPATLGLELAGTVEELGADVTAVAVGDRVAVFAGSGGLAEYGVFDAGRALRVPDAMPFVEAAAFQIAYGTSHLALAHRAAVKPGERVLILGAAGGVGLTAVEIARRLGAEVIAGARGAGKLEIAKAAGADHLIDTGTADLKAELRALGGVDVVYDPVGGDLFTAALRATRPGGRILVIGFASGTVPPVAANHLLVKNISLLGVYWGGYLNFDPDALTSSLSTLLDWYAEGGLRPHISHVLPLERAAEGLELLRSRASTGKVVITP